MVEKNGFAAYVAELPLISSHEHHSPAEMLGHLTLEALFCHSYVVWGYPDIAKGFPPDREEFLQRVRHKASLVWLERGLQSIYGVDELTTRNWDEISARIQRANTQPGWGIEVLRRFAHYHCAVQDSYWSPGSDGGRPDFLRPAYRINAFVLCHHREMRDHNGNSPWTLGSFPETDFDAYLAALDREVAARKSGGAVALKSALAYDRPIHFKPRARAEAAAVFGRRPGEVTAAQQETYQDYLFDYFCALAAKHDLPLQNHTGTALLSGSNPQHLLPMIERHPGTKFVLFHGGYPWVSEIAALAHHAPNVYPDFCWLPLLRPTAAVRAIRECIEMAATTRTFCWGADAWTGEEAVGAALAYKHVLTLALEGLVREGYFSYARAEALAADMCYRNAARVYKIEGPDSGTESKP